MTQTLENSSLSLAQALKRAGLRLTPQRLAILRLLADSREHPSAQMIHHALLAEYPSLSLATVYNTLETLVEIGLVNDLGSVGPEGVRYDADATPHVNLACTRCHRVIDLPSHHVRHLEEEIAAQSGYAIKGGRVLYYGLCPECQKATSQ
ncbi:MAG: transcriptional repressor [Chloroflexi bacterium]|nr:transcriptional repressor [Chloroflexota bacterium]